MPYKTPEARRAYARNWSARHPGYGAEQSRKRREKYPNAAREEYLKHKAAYVARSKSWQAKNPEKAKASKRKTMLKEKAEKPWRKKERLKAWRKRNWRHVRKARAIWRDANRERINADRRERAARTGCRIEEKARRAAKRKQNPSSDCSAKIRLLKLLPLCQYCFRVLGKGVRRTVDHVVPVNRGGGHVPSNLVAACGTCNSSKADRLLSEWSGPFLEAA